MCAQQQIFCLTLKYIKNPIFWYIYHLPNIFADESIIDQKSDMSIFALCISFDLRIIYTSTLWYFSINGERTYLQVISQNKSITIPIHSGPGVTYSQIGELRVGDIITTLASENDWVKHDKSGWSCQYHDNTKVLRPYTSHKDVN